MIMLLIELGGSKEIGNEVFTEIQYPIAHRLLTKRLPTNSRKTFC